MGPRGRAPGQRRTSAAAPTQIRPRSSATGVAQTRYNTPWGNDMLILFHALYLVDNNGPSSIGGGGTPVQPLAPPITPPDQTASRLIVCCLLFNCPRDARRSFSRGAQRIPPGPFARGMRFAWGVRSSP
jgi:hypothetical protein